MRTASTESKQKRAQQQSKSKINILYTICMYHIGLYTYTCWALHVHLRTRPDRQTRLSGNFIRLLASRRRRPQWLKFARMSYNTSTSPIYIPLYTIHMTDYSMWREMHPGVALKTAPIRWHANGVILATHQIHEVRNWGVQSEFQSQSPSPSREGVYSLLGAHCAT